MNLPADAEGRKLLLLSLLKDTEVLKHATKMMQKVDEKKSTMVRIKSKQWKYCTVITTCKHCGVSTRRIVTLQTHADVFGYVSENGVAHVVTFKTIDEDIDIHAMRRSCDSCREYVYNMSRIELEEKYLDLLKTSNIKTEKEVIREIRYMPEPRLEIVEIEEDEEEEVL